MRDQRVRRAFANLIAVALSTGALSAAAGMPAPGQVVQSSGPLPSFEVATIKPIKEGAPPPPLAWPPPNIVRTIGGTARDIVRIAYGLPPSRASERVLGGPAWIDTIHYDVEGKIPDAVFAEMQKMPPREQGNQKSLMLQALLRDRFKLVAHVETREMPMYELVVAKSGPRLAPAKEPPPDESGTEPPPLPPPGAPPKPENMRQGLMVLRKSATVMEMTAKGQTLDALANQPFFSLDGPIANKTGLTGKYDFVLDWSPEQPGGPAASSDAPADADAPTLFTALQEQLGLKLVPTKGPVEVIVIDHIELPSEN
ncbi:MAG: TIGR03435 family protein [Acidobacteriaceae bacterium]|jgi:uncharacterized protein (TIGR03435 family)